MNKKKKTCRRTGLMSAPLGAFGKTSVFTQEDFNSNDGFLTSTWGPSQWHMLHTISFNYPVNPAPKDKERYRSYILSLKNVLPCGKCRANLKENFKKLPLRMADMESRETFSRYIFNLHELINTMLGKSSGLTYEEVRDTYENFRSRCTSTSGKSGATYGKSGATSGKSGATSGKIMAKARTQKKKESGCTKPLYGKKAKCLLRIVPMESKEPTFSVDDQCIKAPL